MEKAALEYDKFKEEQKNLGHEVSMQELEMDLDKVKRGEG